jgi:hypothetical protein
MPGTSVNGCWSWLLYLPRVARGASERLYERGAVEELALARGLRGDSLAGMAGGRVVAASAPAGRIAVARRTPDERRGNDLALAERLRRSGGDRIRRRSLRRDRDDPGIGEPVLGHETRLKKARGATLDGAPATRSPEERRSGDRADERVRR